MEKTIECLLTEVILKQFLMKFGLEEKVKKLGDFENFVYETYKDGEPCILRLTHNSHRSIDEIASELDWIRHLSKSGLSVPDVFVSKSGEFVESIPVQGNHVFFGSLFSKAKGEPVKAHSAIFDEPLFRLWGETIGKMHLATKKYHPSEGIIARSRWDEDDLMKIEKYFPNDDPEVTKNAKEIIDTVSHLPRSPEDFGLIHSDIHLGNFFFDGKNLNVFDFDDASYHWFVSDLAIPLYYSILSIAPYEKKEERQRFGNRFFKVFIEGYERANQLPEGWEAQLPLMLMLRDVTLYSVLHKKVSPEGRNRNGRIKEMVDEIRDRLRKKQPIYQE
ncbi:phosphotransferase [Bacillus sp. REN3]|uniref:phosphotransferase enzyme family protein n=1 Tax=Bacillus sp. REN3 TaxID=2802440 RepID=UPI001AEF1C1A|nr:phosphotransferase [Bacillus sp. REN3]